MAVPKQDVMPEEQHSPPRQDDISMAVFEALHEFCVSVIRLRTALRRLPGNGEREVAAVTLRAPLQQIETAARDIERWLNARSRFAAQEVRIIHPTGERR